MKSYTMFIILVSVLLFGSGVSFSREPNPDTLEIAIFPKYSHIETSKMFTPLIKILEKALGKKIKLKVARSFKQHIEWMKNDQADIYFQNSLVTAKALENVKILCTCVRDGRSTAKGVIVSLKNNSINSYEDLEYARLGVGPINEEVSFQSVYLNLLTEGFDLKEKCKFNTVKTGKIKKLARGLKHKKHSAIIVLKKDLEIIDQVVGSRNYKVIYEGLELPGCAFVTRKDLYQQIQNNLKGILLDINENNKVLKSILIEKFNDANAEEFEPLMYLTD